MYAVIKYTYPSVGRIYYDLPLFDAHPTKRVESWISQYIAEYYDNSTKKYILSFQPDSYVYLDGSRYDEKGIGLREDQIRIINESYFYLLDHPDIVEISISL